MNSDDGRLHFHMGCGECLQSRRRIVRCASGVSLRNGAKPGTGKAKHDSGRREEVREES